MSYMNRDDHLYGNCCRKPTLLSYMNHIRDEEEVHHIFKKFAVWEGANEKCILRVEKCTPHLSLPNENPFCPKLQTVLSVDRGDPADVDAFWGLG